MFHNKSLIILAAFSNGVDALRDTTPMRQHIVGLGQDPLAADSPSTPFLPLLPVTCHAEEKTSVKADEQAKFEELLQDFSSDEQEKYKTMYELMSHEKVFKIMKEEKESAEVLKTEVAEANIAGYISKIKQQKEAMRISAEKEFDNMLPNFTEEEARDFERMCEVMSRAQVVELMKAQKEVADNLAAKEKKEFDALLKSFPKKEREAFKTLRETKPHEKVIELMTAHKEFLEAKEEQEKTACKKAGIFSSLQTRWRKPFCGLRQHNNNNKKKAQEEEPQQQQQQQVSPEPPVLLAEEAQEEEEEQASPKEYAVFPKEEEEEQVSFKAYALLPEEAEEEEECNSWDNEDSVRKIMKSRNFMHNEFRGRGFF